MGLMKHFLMLLFSAFLHVAQFSSCFADRVDIVKEGLLVQELMSQHKLDEALEHAKLVLSVLDEYKPDMADVYSALVAQLYLYTNQPDKAEPLYRRAVIALRKHKEQTGGLAEYLHELSHILEQRNAYEEAEVFALEARSLLITETKPRFPYIVANLNTLGRISDFRGKHQEAQRYFSEELSLIEKHVPGSPQYRETLFNLSESFRMQGDWTLSAKWCEKAAEAGLPAAQYYMGMRLFAGQGIERNYEKAALWLRKAADAGLPDAQNNLGLMYSQGLGVPQSDTEAIRLYEQSAQLGLAAAQMNLARKLIAGKGTPVNLAKAYYWLSLIAESENGPDEVAAALQLKSEIAAKMTRDQLSDAMKLLQASR
jgi:TPR repeat protein